MKLVAGIGIYENGDFKIYDENDKMTREYFTWRNMCKRCEIGGDTQHKYTTYIGCSVSLDFIHFQDYAQWYTENYYKVPGQRMELDKDILMKGNKTYSPSTCVLVPQAINSLLLKSDKTRGKWLIGVTWNKAHNKFESRCRNGKGKRLFLGYYNTEIEAYLSYVKEKEIQIKLRADEFSLYLPMKVYTSLINYKVDIND
ncbi:hypothetical protein [Clostridium sp.]|uniref:hypothetical protein n=1 Tax=Clostridium sp. TaxID=1506 RepID=UPI001A47DA2F|nr:hypothetical protein [Clostridium sp.]MBK5239803.1 hypothetical protein [Clostridium sp.]